jgi:glycosidase
MRNLTVRKFPFVSIGLSIIVFALIALALVVPSPASMQAANSPPFDFSNSYYLANGINPANIIKRVGGLNSASAFVVDNSNTDPNRNNIRITETTGGFDHEGNPLYYTINGFLMPNAFTNDAAGQKAMVIANSFEAYIFPKASGDPLSPALSNRRQDNLFDTVHGYSVNNPLGIWIAVFVSYTPSAFNTDDGRKILATLAAQNGTDLDGTPMIRQVKEIDFLEGKGLAMEQRRAADGSQGFPWII